MKYFSDTRLSLGKSSCFTTLLSTPSPQPNFQPLPRLPKVLLVYSHDCVEHERVVEAFARFLQAECGCTVWLDIWSAWEISVSKMDWAYGTLLGADKILLINSVGAYGQFLQRFDAGVLSGETELYHVDSFVQSDAVNRETPLLEAQKLEFAETHIGNVLRNNNRRYQTCTNRSSLLEMSMLSQKGGITHPQSRNSSSTTILNQIMIRQLLEGCRTDTAVTEEPSNDRDDRFDDIFSAQLGYIIQFLHEGEHFYGHDDNINTLGEKGSPFGNKVISVRFNYTPTVSLIPVAFSPGGSYTLMSQVNQLLHNVFNIRPAGTTILKYANCICRSNDSGKACHFCLSRMLSIAAERYSCMTTSVTGRNLYYVMSEMIRKHVNNPVWHEDTV